MKKKCMRLLSCIVAAVLLVVSLKYLTDLLQRKSSDNKYKLFFEQKENFDVLLMGTSHVINGIFPMELWNDYGIVSYNFGGHGNAVPTTYWVMENALDYTSPELMVIDCLSISGNSKTNSDISYVHLSLDAFPLGATKFCAVKDLFTEEKAEGKIGSANGQKISEMTNWEFVWDYVIYHDRWDEITKSDFEATVNQEKGAESRIAVAVPHAVTQISSDEKLEGETVGTEYLRKMIEDCQDRGIEVLLVYLPFPAGKGAQRNANRVYDIAAEYGVNYINFLDLSVVDYSTDCYDGDSHLNPSGARKVTDYLGQYIMEHYNISDQRTNKAYSGWFRDYKEYADLKISRLKAQKTLDTYLMLLADKNYNVVFEINNPDIWQSEYYTHLFENLGIDSERVTDQTDFIVVQEAGKAVNYFDHFHDSGEYWEVATLGSFRLAADEDGGYVMYRDDEEFYNISAEQSKDADIRIVTFEKDKMEIVDNVSFSFDPAITITVVGRL